VRYPRKGEAIVPRLLRPLVIERRPSSRSDPDREMLARLDLGPAAWARLPPETCERLSMLVIDRVQTRIHMLPESARRHPLPEPRVALTLPLERRTVNTIRRSLRTRGAGRWTVARYLALPRFGGRALVDLLAAVEARQAVPPESAEDGARGALLSDRGLDRALRLIAGQLPVAEEQAQAALVREGLVEGPCDLAALARTAVQMGRRAPFRIAEVGGSRMLVGLADVTAALATYRIAVRAVQGFGTATIRLVADRLALVLHAVVATGFVERLLVGLSRFRWLDRRDGWFWFAQRQNPLVDDLRRIFSIATNLSFGRLWAALFRRREGPDPSPEAIAALCSAIPDAAVGAGVVTVDPPFDRAVYLSRTENRVAALLEAAPTGLSAPEIRDRARALGLPWASVWRLLGSSPLVELSPAGRYRLVGAPAG
jgi:hypothetical protein